MIVNLMLGSWCLLSMFFCCFIFYFYQLGEPPVSSSPGTPSCNPHGDPPIYGDCWYNCTLDDISGEDKRRRLRKVLLYRFYK